MPYGDESQGWSKIGQQQTFGGVSGAPAGVAPGPSGGNLAQQVAAFQQQRGGAAPTGNWMQSLNGGGSGSFGYSGAGVGNYSPAGSLSPNFGEAAAYSKYSPEELQNMHNVSQLAGALGGGVQGYNQALSYYQAILGGDKAAAQRATAPTQEAIAENYRGAERGLADNASLRGGARDQALAEMARQKAGQMSGVIMQQQPGAAQAAGQLGLAGGQAAGSLASGLAQMQMQNRQFGIQAEQANRFQGINAMLQDKGLDINKALGFGQLQLGQSGLDLQRALGFAGLDLQKDLGQQGLDLQKLLGQAGINLSQQQIDLATKQYQNQRQDQRDAKGGQLLGTGAQALALGL